MIDLITGDRKKHPKILERVVDVPCDVDNVVDHDGIGNDALMSTQELLQHHFGGLGFSVAFRIEIQQSDEFLLPTKMKSRSKSYLFPSIKVKGAGEVEWKGNGKRWADGPQRRVMGGSNMKIQKRKEMGRKQSYIG